ncbi:hypothetical protein ECDEC10A_4479 [Escherichia coli DEC10A]|nr:hypothetical protein ECDEC10A_4479 [Escherichia coli DEC10A]
MNSRTNRDVAHRQGVTWFDCSINARLNLVASFQAFRGQDVTAFTVFVQNQRDVRGTVRIVLKTFNNCRDTVFVAFEVNNTVSLLVATTDMTSGDTAIVVTTTGFAVFSSNGAKGLPLCSSGLTTLTTWRRPGDVGLHLTTAIVLLLRLTQRRQRSPDSGLLSG